MIVTILFSRVFVNRFYVNFCMCWDLGVGDHHDDDPDFKVTTVNIRHEEKKEQKHQKLSYHSQS